MKYLPLSLVLWFAAPTYAEPVTLTAEDWARPRSGEALAQHPPLVQVVESFDRQADGEIVIAHSAGEEGQLWAQELQSWFVALGVSSSRIRMQSRVDLHGALIVDARAR